MYLVKVETLKKIDYRTVCDWSYSILKEFFIKIYTWVSHTLSHIVKTTNNGTRK